MLYEALWPFHIFCGSAQWGAMLISFVGCWQSLTSNVFNHLRLYQALKRGCILSGWPLVLKKNHAQAERDKQRTIHEGGNWRVIELGIIDSLSGGSGDLCPPSRNLGSIEMAVSGSAFIIQGTGSLLPHCDSQIPMRQCPQRTCKLDKPHSERSNDDKWSCI